MCSYLKETPWDKRTFQIDTYELTASHEDALKETESKNGHFTVKVDPLENPKNLLNHGFYYMDTLIEPVCSEKNLNRFELDGIALSRDYDADEILAIAADVFMHGRFHRDFHIPDSLADKRYMRWVEDLLDANNVYSLIFQDQTIGFYAFEKDKALLLGIKKEFQSKGLAKPFTSLACSEQLKSGYDELRTSISAANVASLNLFYTLGFKLKKTVDVYHKLNGPAPRGT